MNLSQHFSLEELVRSDTANERGIDNSPSPAVIESLKRTATMLEQVREILGGHPITISSGYRCSALNAAVGGVSNSAHLSGLAADIVCPSYGDPIAVCRAIAASHISFDQLIHEHGGGAFWTHIAVGARREILHYENGIYERGLP